ncbi:hypothetical protein MAPG_11569 [Magnaporthiopsis poae ATCC 64411]|uniref:Uncharacterized protein n=1 Tax=Magnaporthiopsis poae (strain ATCC 64411 / 73-15) TaxID=644358 RepID=A0A0C4EFL8_MAGP6|nr:hypothetical protein MAPG_11569 [Magnaporthiopsis poae ATCC 64411]
MWEWQVDRNRPGGEEQRPSVSNQDHDASAKQTDTPQAEPRQDRGGLLKHHLAVGGPAAEFGLLRTMMTSDLALVMFILMLFAAVYPSRPKVGKYQGDGTARKMQRQSDCSVAARFPRWGAGSAERQGLAWPSDVVGPAPDFSLSGRGRQCNGSMSGACPVLSWCLAHFREDKRGQGWVPVGIDE